MALETKKNKQKSKIKQTEERKQKKEALIWLYLKVNISKFCLILLDHITYNVGSTCSST